MKIRDGNVTAVGRQTVETAELDDGRLVINQAFWDVLKLNGLESASALWSIRGEDVKKQLTIRGTERVFLESPDGSKIEAYLKRYRPLPWREYFKNIVSHRPFFPKGAEHEWDAIRAFLAAGIPTMQPIAVASMDDGCGALLTLGITEYRRASDLLAEWQIDSRGKERTELVEKIAELAGKMHSAEFAHQDFYLVHLFVVEGPTVMPIDLQRVVFNDQFSKRWRTKDLGQLLYSARKSTTTQERRVFWETYVKSSGMTWKQADELLQAVKRKADAIERRSKRKAGKK